MVECECDLSIRQILLHRVLIDTWWNVNIFLAALARLSDIVLIDTWWNVNEELPRLKPTQPQVLIDTWLNVNLKSI